VESYGSHCVLEMRAEKVTFAVNFVRERYQALMYFLHSLVLGSWTLCDESYLVLLVSSGVFVGPLNHEGTAATKLMDAIKMKIFCMAVWKRAALSCPA
jgi:hypothetical protein